MHEREGAGLDSQATADCCPTVCLSQAITQVLRRNDWVKGLLPGSTTGHLSSFRDVTTNSFFSFH